MLAPEPSPEGPHRGAEAVPVLDSTVPPEEVEAQLQRILQSEVFCNAPRHSRFLEFTVRKTLAGESDEIKEYLVGLEVFERQPDFDPRSDPIVRAEARRLRSRLADYYKTLGEFDPVEIDLPKGTYVPVFRRNGHKAFTTPEISSASQPSSIVPEPENAPIQNPPAEPKVELAGHKESRARSRMKWALGLVAVLAIASGTIYYLRHHSVRLTPTDTIVLADFTNTTGDPVFDDTLRQGLSAQLEQSPFLNLLSDKRIAAALSLMGQSKDVRLTRQLARDVCQRTSSVATIEGSIATQGSRYVLGLRAVDCYSGEVLASQRVTANGRDAGPEGAGHGGHQACARRSVSRWSRSRSTIFRSNRSLQLRWRHCRRTAWASRHFISGATTLPRARCSSEQ